MNKKRSVFLVFMLSLLFTSVAWAQINTLELSGMSNALLLMDDIAAGGPPTESDIKKAKEMGVKTIIDLRVPEQTEAEKDYVISQGLNYFNIPVTPETLSRAQVDAVVEILDDPANRVQPLCIVVLAIA